MISMEDAASMAQLYQENELFLRPWERARDPSFFTVEGQRAVISSAAAEQLSGRHWPGVICLKNEPIGQINLNNIIRGALRGCSIGYWVAEPFNGRGVATKAVRQCLDVAFNQLRLHRVDASARVDNFASQRVLEHNGFRRIGIARCRTHLDGRWHDEQLFEKLAPWDDGVSLQPR